MMNFFTLFILILRVFSTIDRSKGAITENNHIQTEHEKSTETHHNSNAGTTTDDNVTQMEHRENTETHHNSRSTIDDDVTQMEHQENTETYHNLNILNDPSFEALAVWVKKSHGIPFQVRLPYYGVESEPEYGEIEFPNKKIQYLCPPEEPEDIDDLRKIEMIHPDANFCLLDHSGSQQQSKCRNEVRPYFAPVRSLTKLETSCGKLYENRLLYTFGYMDEHGKPLLRSSLLGIYEICFNTYQSKTMWTKHTVQTGLMLKYPGLPSQHIEYPSKFRKYSFDLPESIFTDIETEYDEQKNTNLLYIMIPQMLVPQDDLALKLWKKSAQHYVNTAPLWNELVPLMNAINDGIRKVGVTIHLKNYERKEIEEEKKVKNAKKRSEEKSTEEGVLEEENTVEKEEKYDDEDEIDTHTLYIYTSVTIPYLSRLKRFYNFMALNLLNKQNEPFGWNIWCKFIYDSYKNEGVMIYLHNLPDNPPEVSPPTQNNLKPKELLKNKECANPVHCDFKSWSYEPITISDDLLKYAYCCPVDEKKINELFNITVDKKINLLNIDSTVKENRY